MKLTELQEKLVCPKCHSSLRLSEDPRGFICKHCRLLYPIDDHDIPIMLPDEAISLSRKDL